MKRFLAGAGMVAMVVLASAWSSGELEQKVRAIINGRPLIKALAVETSVTCDSVDADSIDATTIVGGTVTGTSFLGTSGSFQSVAGRSVAGGVNAATATGAITTVASTYSVVPLTTALATTRLDLAAPQRAGQIMYLYTKGTGIVTIVNSTNMLVYPAAGITNVAGAMIQAVALEAGVWRVW